MEDLDPHPRATEIIQRIDIARVTNKQVRRVLNLKREGFDAIEKMDKDKLHSYFGEYSPFSKGVSDTGWGRRVLPRSGQVLA